MKAVEELPNREGEVAMQDVKTVEVLGIFTTAFSKKTTCTQMINTISATDDGEGSQSRKKKE